MRLCFPGRGGVGFVAVVALASPVLTCRNDGGCCCVVWGEITIPPEAWREFGFRAEGETIFTSGSRRSGGFGISTLKLMAGVSERLKGATLRVLDGRVIVPPEVGVKPGDRLLTVRGSRYGLGFVAKGPIYKEAVKHPGLDVFSS